MNREEMNKMRKTFLATNWKDYWRLVVGPEHFKHFSTTIYYCALEVVFIIFLKWKGSLRLSTDSFLSSLSNRTWTRQCYRIRPIDPFHLLWTITELLWDLEFNEFYLMGQSNIVIKSRWIAIGMVYLPKSICSSKSKKQTSSFESWIAPIFNWL